MVIITAATVVLVLTSGIFATQILARQQGANEYDTMKKSLLTFDDAFRDIAFDRGGSRSVRFTTKYGYMKLIPNAETLNITVTEFADVNFMVETGAIKYSIPTSYVTYGEGHSSYILGSQNVAVKSANESMGRIFETQQSGFLTMDLNYGVRVTREGPSTSTTGGLVNYIDILVMRMNITKPMSLAGDFELVAKNLAITTIPHLSGITSASGMTCHVVVKMGANETTIEVPIGPGQIVFNLIIADIKVGN